MTAFAASVNECDNLYQELAKLGLLRDYLTVADVLGMQIALISRYGGAPGVRDSGGLEAALFRPQTGYYGDVVA
jgi:hypothetical protein